MRSQMSDRYLEETIRSMRDAEFRLRETIDSDIQRLALIQGQIAAIESLLAPREAEVDTDMEQLRRFLATQTERPDEYEVWGDSERPAAVVTLGALRAVAYG